MNLNLAGYELLFQEVILGLCIIFVVAIYNIFGFTMITLAYRKKLTTITFSSKYVELTRFTAYTMLLVVGIFSSLIVWVIALTLLGMVADTASALLLTASFFTSVGNFTLDLPFGWRLMPSLIAFSGLFSFAWATASSINMANQLGNYLEKHKDL
ncbi:hypothetical protein [Polynucleobacter antarcticus]|uniref:Uncharacterized protein n=1 Tax=Polynucleobacter antarcticus TaxID=1743162 RepID=A0A6M9PU51_9BURK|nr:hypothetical protein [Polynucleobacter antarcticus]QKM62397.1 hypothetical protein DCO16_04580 [Polynucleobacter antarcticus]